MNPIPSHWTSKYPPPGIEIGALLQALWDLYLAATEEHGYRDYEGECPVCDAVRGVQKLLPSLDGSK